MSIDNCVQDEFAQVLTSVWWDIENCPVPKGFDDYASIFGNIKTALRRANYFGEVSISGFGNLKKVKSEICETLGRSGIKMNHIFSRADKTIMLEMLLWALEHDPPANILLISEDIDFATTLNRLSSKMYNIMVAHQNQDQRVQFQTLLSSAICIWSFRDLIEGGSSSLRNYGRVNSVPSVSAFSTIKLFFQDKEANSNTLIRLISRGNDIDLLTSSMLEALSFFKSDLIAPTEQNLLDYFLYKHPHINFNEALTYALEHNVIVKQGKDEMKFYLPVEKLWEFKTDVGICGNPTEQVEDSQIEELCEKTSSDGDTSDGGDTSESERDLESPDLGIKAEELYDKVKKERVPLVKSIFEKYGDIFARCNSTLEEDLEDWEYICVIYESLKEYSIKIALKKLKSYRSTMCHFDCMDVKIGWFKKRIDAIIKVKELIKAGLTFSDAKERVYVAIENNKKDMETKKKKLAAGMSALKLVPQRRHPRIKECREHIKLLEEEGAVLVDTMNVLLNESLVDGLL
ncbi:hypothetical protein ABFX02_11G122800 [Erythranthe guttata]